MEIGSFIELQLPQGMEYYAGDDLAGMDIVRLNSGRAAIYHAFRITGCRSIWIPYYQCESVRKFLKKQDINIKYYHIDRTFSPLGLTPTQDESVLIVNYFGIMSPNRIKEITSLYSNVIIDNSQAFFASPLEGCLNVYSARKFFGVPDGAYVIGEGAGEYISQYNQGYSSDTALFLLQRIEYGCEGEAYKSRLVNENRIDAEDIMLMSKLTRKLLDGTDYEYIRERRRGNFQYSSDSFSSINEINPLLYYNNQCVPMVYPLVIEDDSLLGRLLNKKHFQGHWWSYLCSELSEQTFEYWLSRYLVPITIDQRYGKTEIDFISRVVIS